MNKISIMFLATAILWCPTAACASQETPEDLAALWVHAISSHSTEEIKPLIHPSCPKDSVTDTTLERMVSGDLPPDYKVETKDLGPKEMLEKVYAVIPEKQLGLMYITTTKEDRAKFGLGKAFPIAQSDGKWFFVPCLKTK